MDDTLDDFVSQFHNLAGITIGERTKNFYKLLHVKKITRDQEQHILDNLKPDTYLQKLFQIDILLRLRKTKQLIQILKGGNEVFASKIMKQEWFLKEVLDNVGADELVNNILPSISFSVRVKLLKKLVVVLTAEQLDKVFDAVLRRYGLFIATILITGCTPEKIETILKNNEIKLSSRDLKKLHKKDPKLIESYIEEMNQRKNKILCDNDFLIYLAQNDPVFFWTITKKYRFDNEYKIGRRTTKKLINTGKTEIVSDPKRYLKYLRTETLIRKLNSLGDFKQFYTNLFPESVDELDENQSCTTILKYYPKSNRYNLFLETFNNVIGDEIWSSANCYDDFFLELICDESIREKWARIKYQESKNIEYFKYYEINNCVTLIKERINFTSSVKQRSKLLCILVKCCEINGNLGQLEQVIEWSLKHDPMIMVNKFDIKMIMPYRFWHKIKLYSHLGLDKMIKTNCINQLSCEECYTKSDLILPISVLSTSEEYFKIMEDGNYFPTTAKVVIEDEQTSELFKLRKMFISNLKNTKEPVQYLPVLMDKFLLGDYLQSSLPSLYSAFSNSPEILLENYIDKLLKNKHMSVQKHALFLACSVLDHENVVRVMRYFKDKENDGIGKFLFLSSLKYFSKNPTDDLFDLVKAFMTFLKEQDIESMKVSTTTNITNNFKPSYVQSFWKVLVSFENNTEINKIKSEYLESLDDICIRKLSLNFCEDIIQNYFLKQKGEKDCDIPGINSFVTKFLINYNDTPHKFALVFNIVQNFKAEFWSKSNILERKKIYTFFNAFYKEVCDKKVKLEIIAKFSNCWNNLFTPVDTFEEYVLLNMLQYQTESSTEQCAKKIVEFSENIVEKLGQIVFSKFVATLAKSFTCKDEERINLLYEILKIKTSSSNCILVIKLIETKGDLFHNDKIRKKYLKIDDILKESCDSNIQLFRNLYLKNVD